MSCYHKTLSNVIQDWRCSDVSLMHDYDNSVHWRADWVPFSQLAPKHRQPGSYAGKDNSHRHTTCRLLFFNVSIVATCMETWHRSALVTTCPGHGVCSSVVCYSSQCSEVWCRVDYMTCSINEAEGPNIISPFRLHRDPRAASDTRLGTYRSACAHTSPPNRTGPGIPAVGCPERRRCSADLPRPWRLKLHRPWCRFMFPSLLKIRSDSASCLHTYNKWACRDFQIHVYLAAFIQVWRLPDWQTLRAFRCAWQR